MKRQAKGKHGPSAGNANRVSGRVEAQPRSNAAETGTPAQAGEPLTKADKERLQQLEKTIGSGLTSFVDVGRALMQINTGRLYREESATFEDYCELRWDLSRQYGYRLIKAAACYDTLKSKLPRGTRLPQNESQLRPLVEDLKPGKWVDAWKRVIASNLGVKLTAEAVAKVVHSFDGESSRSNTVRRKKALPTMSKKLAKVVGIVKKALDNRAASVKDHVNILRVVLRKLTALQVGPLHPGE